jgi:HAD superfamily hydrolase (TIGR01484 family)
MYKAIITDLDGSAVNISSDGSDVSEETRAAVRTAQDAGYIISCATGREWDISKPVVTSLGLTSPCVIAGGSAIIDSVTEEVLWEKHLEAEAVRAVFAIYKSLASSGRVFSAGILDDLTAVDALDGTRRLVYLLGCPADEALEIQKEINATGMAAAHLTPSWDGDDKLDVHTTHPAATKEHAIKVWHQLVDIRQAETIGIGDSGNDLPLFRAAGLKIATGNATDELKGLADHVSPPVWEGALKYVIETYLLSQQKTGR